MKYLIKLEYLFLITFQSVCMCSIGNAQIVNFDTKNGAVEISADDGIEWQQESFVFIAKGNAKAVRENLEVKARELRAYYKKLKNGSTEVIRLDAISDITIVSDEYTAYGDHAIYDMDSKIITMTGKKLKLVAKDDWLSAKDQLEFWEKKQMAVARGNAMALRGDRKIYANVLAAYFKKTKREGSKIYRVDAFENVKIITNKDEATSDRGVYNVESGIATLTGSVKIKRGTNVLQGCSAQVNLNTGISQLNRCPSGKKRVRGSVVTKTK